MSTSYHLVEASGSAPQNRRREGAFVEILYIDAFRKHITLIEVPKLHVDFPTTAQKMNSPIGTVVSPVIYFNTPKSGSSNQWQAGQAIIKIGILQDEQAKHIMDDESGGIVSKPPDVADLKFAIHDIG